MSQYSFVRYTSAGSAGPYAVPFPYRNRADVKAYVNDVEVTFTWTTSASITLTNAPAVEAIVEIKRNTSQAARLTQWSSVSQLDADTLDTDSLQAFYMAQEAIDAAGEGEQVVTDGIEDNAVTNAKLEDMAQNTIKGRASSGTGDPENLTGTQVATMLPEFAGSSKGLVPASLNVPDTFLRGDGQWAIPEGSGGGGGGGAIISDGDKGDITVSGSGAVWTIDPNSVTFSKMADMDSGSVIYRRTAGSGDPEAQPLATLKSDLGLTGTNSGDQTITLTGDVTGSGSGSFTTTISNDAVTTAKMANVASATVFYRKTTGTGDPEVQPLATLKTDLGLVGSNTGDQTITLTGDVGGTGTGSFAATIANDAVSNAKLANMANATIKGRNTTGTGDPEDLTAAQVTALLDEFTSSDKGLAPASGGGTTNFLRADGQWVAPPAGEGGSQNLFETIAVAGNTSVVADATNDTLTLAAGSNIAITTNAATDTITFAVTGLGDLATKSTISNADIDANAAIAHTKLASLPAAHFILGDASGVPTATYMKGEVVMGPDGATTIANNVVDFSQLADIPTNNIIGRVTGGTGDPEDLTADEVIGLINTATTNTLNFTRLSGAAPSSHNQAWSTITSTPTTLSGYGITDALSNSASSTQTGTFGDIKLRDDTSPSHYLTITDAENLTQDVTLSLNMNNDNRTLSLAGNLTVSGNATVSGTHTGSASGTNTGDQTITLTGDVTGSGTGSFGATIANNAVSLAKMATVATDSILGRATASTGNVEVLTALPFAFTGDVTRPADSNAQTIANSAVTLAKMADVATSSVFYRKTAGTGAPEVQALSTLKTDLGLTGTNSGDQTIALTGDVTGSGTGSFAATIAANSVGMTKLADIAAVSVIGRYDDVPGDPAALTPDQLISVINAATSTTINSNRVAGVGNNFTTIAVPGASNVVADQASDTLTMQSGGPISITTNASTDTITIGLSDGDRGDITVSSSGNTWTIDNDAVTYAKLQNVTATDRLLGRSTAGAGDVEEITCTAAGRALIDDATTLAQQQTLGAFDTVAAVNAATIDSSVNHIRTAGYYAAGDGGGALYKKGPSAQANTPANTAANRKYIYSGTAGNYQYWELAAEDTNVLQFGAYNNDTNASATLLAFQGAALFSKSIHIPPGTYLIDGTITVTLDGQRWYGDGFNAAIVKSNSTTLPMFTITEFLNNIVLESFRLTRSVTATSGANGIDLTNKVVGQTRFQYLLVEKQWDGFALSSTDWSEVLDCIAQQNVNNGVFIRNKNTAAATSIACQWNITNTLSQMNGARGFFYQSQSGPSGMIVGPLKMCATFANTGVGVGFLGSVGVPIYDARVLGGFYGSDANSAIYVDTYGDQHLIQNCFLERTGRDATGPTLTTAASGTGSGLEVTANNTGIIVNNVHAYENSLDGIALSATSSVVSGCRCDNNGQAASAGRRNGIYIVAGRASITGVRCGNTSGTAQSYGVRAADGTNVAMAGADLTGNGVSALDITSNANSLSIVASLPNTINTQLPIVEINAGTATAPTLTTKGDTNTGMYYPAADNIAFTTGGTRRLRIMDTGNVAIGSANDAPGATGYTSFLALGNNNAGIGNVGTNEIGLVSANVETLRSVSTYLKTSVELRVTGDSGGQASHNTITGTSDVTANSTGTGTIKFKGTTSRDSSGFIKIYIGTTAYYVPVFSAITG